MLTGVLVSLGKGREIWPGGYEHSHRSPRRNLSHDLVLVGHGHGFFIPLGMVQALSGLTSLGTAIALSNER